MPVEFETAGFFHVQWFGLQARMVSSTTAFAGAVGTAAAIARGPLTFHQPNWSIVVTHSAPSKRKTTSCTEDAPAIGQLTVTHSPEVEFKTQLATAAEPIESRCIVNRGQSPGLHAGTLTRSTSESSRCASPAGPTPKST